MAAVSPAGPPPTIRASTSILATPGRAISPSSGRRRPSCRSCLPRPSTSGRLDGLAGAGLGVAGMGPVLDRIGALFGLREVLVRQLVAGLGFQFGHGGLPRLNPC